MKPQSVEGQHKKPDWIALSTFAFCERDQKMPTTLEYCEHLMPYVGADDLVDIPWGVYGTTSLTMASYYATNYATSKKQYVLHLTLWYSIEGFAQATAKSPQSLADCRGFLNTGRIGVNLREQMREEVLAIATEGMTKRQLAAYEDIKWVDLLIKHPSAVRQYLAAHNELDIIVHPVLQTFDRHSKEPVVVGSFKLRRDRIMAAEVRFQPSLQLRV